MVVHLNPITNWVLSKLASKAGREEGPVSPSNEDHCPYRHLELPGKTIVDTLEVPTLDQWTAWENDSLRIELSLVKDAVTGHSRIKFKADIKPQTITREVKVDCPPSVIQKPSSRSRLSSFVLYALGALFVYGVGYLHGRVTGRG